VWLQAFYEYWANPSSVQRRWENGSVPTRTGRKHRILFFRDRDQYRKTLSQLGVEGVDQSTGYYNDRNGTICLYDDPQPDLDTWRQEQCHQLFQEQGAAKSDPVEKSHIWVLEGLGIYFESLVEYPARDDCTLGGFDARRLQFARIRWNREGFWVPLEELTAMSRDAFLSDPRVAPMYSQAGGLMHFLMDGDHGRFRAPVLQLARLVYAKRAKPESLAELCGVDLRTLEERYKAWLPVESSEVAQFLTLAPQRTELALGFSDLDSNATAEIAACTNLDWLQLSRTRVDDRVGPVLENLSKLRQLFLDQTQVTDRVLPHLARLANLEELDLAGTGITDEGLLQIGRLSRLKVLWLGSTKITDEGLAHLSQLHELQMLDTSQTAVTDAGLKKLKSQLPQLR
jgi:hypothetical protein